MKSFVSAGVYTRETDLTHVPRTVAEIGAAIIGRSESGPAFLPVDISSFGEYRTVFGGTDYVKYGYMAYASQAHLNNTDRLKVVRVLGEATVNVGPFYPLAFPDMSKVAVGGNEDDSFNANNIVLAVLRGRADTGVDVSYSGTPTSFGLTAGDGASEGSIGAVAGAAASLNRDSNNFLGKLLGTDPLQTRAGDALTSVYIDALFSFAVGGSITGATSANTSHYSSVSATHKQVSGGYKTAVTPYVISQNFNGQTYRMFRLASLSDGEFDNTRLKISIQNVEDVDNSSATSYPKFDVLVRDFDDNDLRPSVLEQFTDVNMDPNSTDYIGRKIGDMKPMRTTGNPYDLRYDGDYETRSRYIRVEFPDVDLPGQASPRGFEGLGTINMGYSSNSAQIASLTEYAVKTNQQINGVLNDQAFLGINFDAVGIADRLKGTISSISGASTSDRDYLISVSDAEMTNSANLAAVRVIDMITDSASATNFSSFNKVRFSFPFHQGFDGFDPRSDLLVDDNDGTLSGEYNNAMYILQDPDYIDFNLIVVPGVHSSATGTFVARMLNMVSERSDVFYAADIGNDATSGSGKALTVSQARTEADKYDSSYGAVFYPWLKIPDADNNRLIWVPPTVEVFGAIAFNDAVGHPWFAPAGFIRGALDNASEVRRKLRQTDRIDLEAKNVNPIVMFPGQVPVIYAQNTLQKKDSVLSKINVRRLLIYAKKLVASSVRNFLFEPNNQATRNRILDVINPILTRIQRNQGLERFEIILTATEDEVDANQITGKIIMLPTRAAEVIVIDFISAGTGAQFDELVG